MSAISMMMRDTGSVSRTSSNDSNPSHTDTSTPSSDLPEHVTNNNTTNGDITNTTNERLRSNTSYRNRWMINRANIDWPMSDEDWAMLDRC